MMSLKNVEKPAYGMALALNHSQKTKNIKLKALFDDNSLCY
jgi:hypothetical protein